MGLSFQDHSPTTLTVVGLFFCVRSVGLGVESVTFRIDGVEGCG